MGKNSQEQEVKQAKEGKEPEVDLGSCLRQRTEQAEGIESNALGGRHFRLRKSS